MKKVFQLFFLLAALVGFVGMPSVKAQSVTATLVFSPSSKSVAVNESFPVDVLIRATGAKRVGYTRAIITFDPTLIEVTQVQHSQIFCNFPTDGANYVVDNSGGTIMITGIATGAEACPFPEITEQGDIFARITVKAKAQGTAAFEFLYNGQSGDTVSGITDTNSPSQYIMTAPQKATYTIGGITTTTAPPADLGVDPRIVIGGALIIAAIGWMTRPQKQQPRVLSVTE